MARTLLGHFFFLSFVFYFYRLAMAMTIDADQKALAFTKAGADIIFLMDKKGVDEAHMHFDIADSPRILQDARGHLGSAEFRVALGLDDLGVAVHRAAVLGRFLGALDPSP